MSSQGAMPPQRPKRRNPKGHIGSKELAKLKTNDHFLSITSADITNPYHDQIAKDEHMAQGHLEEFIEHTGQKQVLEFAYKAKVLYQSQQIHDGIDSVRDTLSSIESTEASTTSQLSSLTNIATDAREQVENRLDDLQDSVQAQTDELKKFECALEQLNSAMAKMQSLESSLATSIHNQVSEPIEQAAQSVIETEHRLSSELLGYVRDTHKRLSEFAETMSHLRFSTSSLTSRLEHALSTIPKEIESLKETLKETKPLNIPEKDVQAVKKYQTQNKATVSEITTGPRLTRQYEEWRDYYSNFGRMYRVTSMSEIDFIWLFLDHIPNEALSLQIQRNLLTAIPTKPYVKTLPCPKGRRRIEISPNITWEMVKRIVKVVRVPFTKFVPS